LSCNREKELKYCEMCVLFEKSKEKLWSKSPSDVISEVWELKDKINELYFSIEEIRKILCDFKIRGLKLKSIKEKSTKEGKEHERNNINNKHS